MRAYCDNLTLINHELRGRLNIYTCTYYNWTTPLIQHGVRLCHLDNQNEVKTNGC